MSTIGKILNTQTAMTPRIVSLEDLRAVLLPLCFGYSWAENAIVDLWLKGAPVPQDEGQPERRILIPAYFRQWWGEVQHRMGIPIEAHHVFPDLSSTIRSHNDFRRRRA